MTEPPQTTGAPDEAWRQLFVAEFARVVAVCRSVGAVDPEDVAQEAFVRTYRHRDRIADGRERGYLYVTAVNLVRTRARRKPLTDHGWSLVPPDGPASDVAVLADVENRAVRLAVQALGHREREVIVLRYWAGLSDAEIATHLGLPGGTVRSRISRALTRLARNQEGLQS